MGLHCPNCGAAADFEARRCPFCQSQLATISCPHCFGLMFDGAAFCPKCGTPRARREAEDAATSCPACQSQLRAVTIGATTLLECASCDGVWVDAEVFERLCADRESQAAVLPKLSAPKAATNRPGRIKYRPCVRCRKMMNRVNFGSISGAVIDVCKGHGTFLDAGELHQIVTFIHDGGLDRARERKLEELREEERNVREMQRKAASRQPPAARWPGVPTPEPGHFNSGALQELIDLLTQKYR
jgi:Zn-finger nucleic acid-binding protein